MKDIYEERQNLKQNNQRYRDAVVRLYPQARVTLTSTIYPTEDGAFVEVNVWVPKEAIKE